MKQSHPNCQDPACSLCFREMYLLERYLEKATGDEHKTDHLGKYHKWLADNNIPNETEVGWASPETFLDENINAYIRWFKETK